MKRLLLATVILFSTIVNLSAQRTTDLLDRGLVAVPSGSGSFVSWRIFGEEYYDTKYNLYRDGVKANDQPLNASCFTDAAGRSGSTYQVAAVVRGVEQAKSEPVSRLARQYMEFAVGKVYSRRGTDITSDYNVNDIALADVTGDGRSEFIVKRNYGPDGSSVGNDSAYNHLECYTLEGERLWWIDLGPNMVSGPDEQYDAVGYDWDGDGCAEVLMRGADNMVIHHADGTTTEIGNMRGNTRNTVTQTANMTYTNTGAEYLLYLDGQTGKPYPIGPGGQLWMTYPLPRGAADDWGDGYGHRSTKHYFGAPFLDGRKAYVFLGRGCYTKHHMKAFSVDPETHKLTLYWEWKCDEGWDSPWYGNGFHNFGIADVDWDGRDEICFGSMVIDDNGRGLSTTGLGHGDAQHCSDFDPYRHGQEIFTCNEDEPAMNYRDATTSKIYYRLQSTSDDGRALCGNFSNAYPGAIGHSSQSGTISCVSDKVIAGGPGGFTNNWRIYWDGDLLEEGLDGASSREGAARVFKADGSVVFTADGTANCNWTKNTPSAVGDIMGDWREEIIVRTTDNKYVRVYTTNIPTRWRNYTLWHDHQYRQGMVWESIGYNQPPHASYFLGELEGITQAPPPLTTTGRVVVADGSAIGSEQDGQHVLLCDYADTQLSVAEGSSPWGMTFNVPSWIQGTNSNNTVGNPLINRTYYTCEVSGAAFTGATRLVKQGDGTLRLPAVEQAYTGPTDVWAGTLCFDGTLLHSPLWLNRFAVLESDGGRFRSIKMDYAAELRPGGPDHQGQLTTDSLTLGFGSRVVFDLYDGFQSDLIEAGRMAVETKSWQYGPQYLTPVFEFRYHGDGDVPEGDYLIGRAATLVGSLASIRIEGISTKMKAALELRDADLYLVVSGMRDAGTIVWTGRQNGVWDLAETENFVNKAAADASSDFFVTGDNVWFTDAADANVVSLRGELEADTVFVDNTAKDYRFEGSGALVGQTTLVKRGTGLLTITNDNTFTGGVRLEGGAVSIASMANANQPKGHLGGVTTLASRFVIADGAELRTTAAVTCGSAIQMSGDEGGVINNAADFISNRAITGTVLTKRGAGWMKLNTSNTSLQRLVIAGGTVQCVNANMPAQTVEFQNGTLLENTSSGYNIHVPANKRGTWNLVDRGSFSNRLTGEGTLTVYCPIVVGSGWNATRTQITGNWSAFEGTVNCTVHSKDTRFTLDNGYGMPNGTLNIPEGVEVQNSGRTYRIGRLTGSGLLGGTCSFSSSGNSNPNTWQVGNDANWSTTVRVTSTANLVKVGSGKVTWNSANTNTGTTSVNEGELAVGTSTQLGTGRLNVNEGGVISGSNTMANGLKNSATVVSGTMKPGAYEGASMGSICFDQKPVTFQQQGVLVIGVRQSRTSSISGSTSLEGISTLTFNGTIRLVPAAGHRLQPGDSIRIFTCTTFVGSPTFDMQGDVLWDTSRIAEGWLFVKAVGAGISGVMSDDRPTDIYDAHGRLVRRRATSTEGLRPGIYVSEGRKIIVR